MSKDLVLIDDCMFSEIAGTAAVEFKPCLQLRRLDGSLDTFIFTLEEVEQVHFVIAAWIKMQYHKDGKDWNPGDGFAPGVPACLLINLP